MTADRRLQTSYEYVERRDGSSFILSSARVAHFAAGKMISGFIVDENGPTTERKLIEYADVVKHRCMDWTDDEGLVINETRWPMSLR